MENSQEQLSVPTDNKKNVTRKVLFFLGITTMSAIGGFGMMLSRTERQNQKLKPGARPDPVALETGAGLARKALGRATLYAVSGVSLFCLITWKVIGAKDFEDFRLKLGNTFPRIHRPREPEVVDWDEILGLNKIEEKNEK